MDLTPPSDPRRTPDSTPPSTPARTEGSVPFAKESLPSTLGAATRHYWESWQSPEVRERLLKVLFDGTANSADLNILVLAELLSSEAIRWREILAGTSARANAQDILEAAFEMHCLYGARSAVSESRLGAERETVLRAFEHSRMDQMVPVSLVAKAIEHGGGGLFVHDGEISTLPPVYLAVYPPLATSTSFDGCTYRRVRPDSPLPADKSWLLKSPVGTPLLAVSSRELALAGKVAVLDVYLTSLSTNECHSFHRRANDEQGPARFLHQRGPLALKRPFYTFLELGTGDFRDVPMVLEGKGYKPNYEDHKWQLPAEMRPELPLTLKVAHEETAAIRVLRDIIRELIGADEIKRILPPPDLALGVLPIQPSIRERVVSENFEELLSPHLPLLERARSSRAEVRDIFDAARLWDRVKYRVVRELQCGEADTNFGFVSAEPLTPAPIAERLEGPQVSAQSIREFVECGGGKLYRLDRDLFPPLYLACVRPAPRDSSVTIGECRFIQVTPLEPGERGTLLTEGQLAVCSAGELRNASRVQVFDIFKDTETRRQAYPGWCLRDARSDLALRYDSEAFGKMPMATFWGIDSQPSRTQAEHRAREWYATQPNTPCNFETMMIVRKGLSGA